MSTLITIYKFKTNEVRAIVDPDDRSEQQTGIMRGDIVNISFTSQFSIQFAVGDYCTIFGRNYKLNRPAPFKKTGFANVAYTLTFEGDQYDLARCAYLFLDGTNHFTDGKFSLLGKPIDFMNLIVYNMERWSPGSGWTVGTVDDADYTNIDFDSQNCLEVLGTLATTFQTEYIFDGKKISLTTRQPSSGQTLEYGKGKALCSVALTNTDTAGTVNIVTRLYAYGSSRNIGSNYRDGAKYLRMAAGLYIEKNVSTLGVFEKIIYFDGQTNKPEIYPHFLGVVSAVTDDFTFTDTSIDFDVNLYLIPGVTAQITFNTGQLGGETFDIGSFNTLTQTFVINLNSSDSSHIVPSDLFKPSIGDTYVITGITMPLSYVTDAEAQLLVAAQQYINSFGNAKVTYPIECNPLYFKGTGLQLQLGYTYRLFATEMGIDKQIRVVYYTRNLRKPYIYTPELADKVIPQTAIVKLINSL